MPELQHVSTGALDVAYYDVGPRDGMPVLLLHGYPDDAHAYAAVWSALADEGFRTITPYLRGHGPTRIRDGHARSGQQAAIGQDLLDLLDVLQLGRVGLVGYDWGGRAACIAAALRPSEVEFLVAGQGYLILDTRSDPVPRHPEAERAYWYQWYFCTKRGAAGLAQNRAALAKTLWREWSPSWHFTEDAFARCAPSFDNPDHVEVVLHSYRHRNGEAAGDPRYEDLERRLAAQPTIAAPTIVLHGADDQVSFPAWSEHHARFFTSSYERRLLPGVGHFLPREAPGAIVRAVLDAQQRA
jgi:pimeloyl-ACP methyl ester carboxylesterase